MHGEAVRIDMHRRRLRHRTAFAALRDLVHGGTHRTVAHNKVNCMSNDILDVDLLAFEKGSDKQRKAVVDGVMRSLATGFVYTSHDLSEDMLDTTYSMLYEFFNKPVEEKRRYIAAGANGQTGYTGVLVETAEVSDKPDWKEMLNWGKELPAGHPMKRKFPQAYPDQVLPEASVPGISNVLYAFHDAMIGLQTRFLDRKSTRLNSSHVSESRMPSSA